MSSRSRWILLAAACVGVGLGGLFASWRLRTAVLSFVWPDPDSVEALAGPVREAARAYEAEYGLRWAQMPEELVRGLLPLRGADRVHDPDAWFCGAPDQERWRAWPEHPAGGFMIRTNALGLRMESEVVEPAPGARVLVLGDSHVAGVCASAETFAARLEALLAEEGTPAQVVNGAHGAYGFHQYVGTLERFLRLGLVPDLVVVVVYGGNDFAEVWIRHFLRGTRGPERGPEARERLERAAERYPGQTGQALAQAEYFARGGEAEVELALEHATDAMEALERRAREVDARLVVVYLPSPTEVPRAAERAGLAEGARLLGLDAEDVAVSARLGARFVEQLDAAGRTAVDLRPAFRAAESDLYWSTDLHLNVDGHDLAARAVLPAVRAALRQR